MICCIRLENIVRRVVLCQDKEQGRHENSAGDFTLAAFFLSYQYRTENKLELNRMKGITKEEVE